MVHVDVPLCLSTALTLPAQPYQHLVPELAPDSCAVEVCPHAWAVWWRWLKLGLDGLFGYGDCLAGDQVLDDLAFGCQLLQGPDSFLFPLGLGLSFGIQRFFVAHKKPIR